MRTTLDTQTLINTAAGILIALLGWVGRQIWDAINRLQKDLHSLEVDIPKSYVSKDDFKETMKHIEEMFQRIYDKLDDKADKKGI